MTDRVTLIATLAVELCHTAKGDMEPSHNVPMAVRLVRQAEEAERAEWGMKSKDIPEPCGLCGYSRGHHPRCGSTFTAVDDAA